MFNFDKVCVQIVDRDSSQLNAFNDARIAGNQPHYVLSKTLGPSPFEGNINTAPVVLLLANPSSKDVDKNDHRAPDVDWPLHGLGPHASPPLHRWWSMRLRQLQLATKCDMQAISRSVAAVQINPWASVSYYPGLKLDSRHLQFLIVQSAMARGAILILMRAKREWSDCPGLLEYEHLVETINKRCSYISPGNIEASAWSKIVSAVVSPAAV